MLSNNEKNWTSLLGVGLQYTLIMASRLNLGGGTDYLSLDDDLPSSSKIEKKNWDLKIFSTSIDTGEQNKFNALRDL